MRSSDSQYATAGTDTPWPGVLKSGPHWRISRSMIRRFLLRDVLVMVAAGLHAPF